MFKFCIVWYNLIGGCFMFLGYKAYNRALKDFLEFINKSDLFPSRQSICMFAEQCACKIPGVKHAKVELCTAKPVSYEHTHPAVFKNCAVFYLEFNGLMHGQITVFFKRFSPFKNKMLESVNTIKNLCCRFLFINNKIEELNIHANTDTLTTLYNREYLKNYITDYISREKHDSGQISVIIADVDNLKTINDNFGHIYGDMALKAFSSILKNHTRKSDIVSRYGGDEFVIMLPSTSPETAYKIAQRILNAASNVQIKPNEHTEAFSVDFSCSIGISNYPELCDDISQLIITADIALYEAKKRGKNCISIYQKNLK